MAGSFNREQCVQPTESVCKQSW